MKFKEISLATEEKILALWKSEGTVEFLRDRDIDGAKFYFLEGPPYTSGKIHMGHAWNMALKDMVLRYKRMTGHNVWDRMGYDMHGLPTEQKTMKRFNLKDKQDIEEFGLLRFREECEKFCLEMKEGMDKDFQRLGVTLDFEDSYQPIKNEFIEAVWWLVKQAHSKDRLYQGLRTMHWDFATQTAVAKHELEYKSIKDTSIYVKFPRIAADGSPLSGKYFVIWTTTPWTIPLNLAIMVNPEISYVEVEVTLESGNVEHWVLAKNLHEDVMSRAGKKVSSFRVIGEFFGDSLAGERYEHPLGVRELLPEELQENPKLFSVLLTKEYCDDSSGTGLVHCAPGCGPEDYEVGHLNGIQPFNCVDESGLFAQFGHFTGWKAKLDDQKFIDYMKEKGVLLAKQAYVHDYPHGERSHQPVIFRTTKQWFFKIEDLKDKLLAWNEEVHWVPHTARNAFRGWLENLRDNSISKQRFWGSPVPIWKWESEDGSEEDFIVIGSLSELEELSGSKVTDMHIPAIDDITIEKDGRVYRRVPDVLDVWIDAGTAVWNCLDYPARTDLLEKYYPADFILEGKDQIRGWFNLLMVGAALGLEKLPFKSCFMHGFVTDVDGVKMSKSLGNVISPYEVIDKHGADVLRMYMCRTTAGEDVNFSWDELSVMERRLKIVWNLHKLLLNLSVEVGQNPFELDSEETLKVAGPEEKYILSYLQTVIGEVSSRMEKYELDKVPSLIDDLFLELSRSYVQMVREKSSVGSDEEKEVVLYVLGHVLLEGLKLSSLVAPFASEAMYLNLRDAFDLEEASISHFTWPKVDESLIDLILESSMSIASSVIQSGLNAREQVKTGLRWPIKEMVVVSSDTAVIDAIESLSGIVSAQLNVKSVRVESSLSGVKESVKPDNKSLGPKFKAQSAEVIAKLVMTSSESILAGLNSEAGVFEVVLDSGEKVHVDRSDFEISREVPSGFSEAAFKGGYVYLDLERSLELDSEGYAREIMRFVQSARKKADFNKSDSIVLQVVCPAGESGFSEAIAAYSSEIAAKVGAKSIVISEDALSKDYAHKTTLTVKDKEFIFGFEKA